MSNEDLMGLAERCEKATGPDQSRLLNEAFELIHGDQAHYNALTVAADRHAHLNLLSKLHRCLGAGAYLDAAMTLVPEGWSHGYHWNARHRTAQAHCEYVPLPPFAPADVLTKHSGKCSIPALALCAAALRAQAAQLEQPHD